VTNYDDLIARLVKEAQGKPGIANLDALLTEAADALADSVPRDQHDGECDSLYGRALGRNDRCNCGQDDSVPREDYAPWRDPVTGVRSDSKRGSGWVYEPRTSFPADVRSLDERHTPSYPMEEMHREAVIRAVDAERERDEARAERDNLKAAHEEHVECDGPLLYECRVCRADDSRAAAIRAEAE